MTDNALKETILRMAEPVAAQLGLIVWGVEITRAGRTVVRLFVDAPFSPQAVSRENSQQDSELPRAFSEEAGEPAEDLAGSEAISATLSHCEKISRTLGLALEVENCIPEAYVLEVSTPGLTRLFFSLDQMRRYLGDIVEARLLAAVGTQETEAVRGQMTSEQDALAPNTPHAPYTENVAAQGSAQARGAARRIWRGILREVADDAFSLEPVSITPEGECLPEDLPMVRIPWSAVRRASRMYIFKQPQKPGKGQARKKGPAAAQPQKRAVNPDAAISRKKK